MPAPTSSCIMPMIASMTAPQPCASRRWSGQKTVGQAPSLSTLYWNIHAEPEANFLEANQMVGLCDLPTRRLDMLRTSPPDFAALRKLMEEFTAEPSPFVTPEKKPAHRYYTPAVAR